jgi:hypothetical protein
MPSLLSRPPNGNVAAPVPALAELDSAVTATIGVKAT